MPRYQHPLEIHGFDKMIEDGLDVEDLELKDILLFMLAELKVISEHLAVVTDEEVNVDDKLEV